ncbi:MAG: GNAT family N-acetyltransferase [Acidobacteriota bacterium]
MTPLDLPDVPRWVEAHGIAGDPEGWRDGAVVGHDRARLIVVAGDADPAAIARLAGERAHHTILFAIEREDVAAALRAAGRTTERAILHTLADAATLPDGEGAVPLDDGALGHLPTPLAEELAWGREHGPVWAAWLDGTPVSFAYAPWRSARWFDVSVDTLADARQLGLATIVAAAMIRDERTRGREPVWGADENNLASRRLAKRLGFEPIDEIGVATSRAR